MVMTRMRRDGPWLVLIALVVALLGTDLRAGATVSGTPTPTGCGFAPDASTPEGSPHADNSTPVAGTPEALVGLAQLRAAFAVHGLQIETEEAIAQEGFTAARITRLVVTGEALSGPADLQVYAYADTASRDANAAQITPDGSLPTVMILWIAPPHFFCGEDSIVLYLGEDPVMLALLTELLGPQFAGL
jgi:hypothetical protein